MGDMLFHKHRMLCNLFQQIGSSMSDYRHNLFLIIGRFCFYTCLKTERTNYTVHSSGHTKFN